MFYRCLSHTKHALDICQGLFHLSLTITMPCILLIIISVSTLYSGRSFLILFLCYSSRTLFHGQQVYIVVDIDLYLYALPIDLLLHSYSSLCLSYNLSLAQNCNKNQNKVKYKLYLTCIFITIREPATLLKNQTSNTTNICY